MGDSRYPVDSLKGNCLIFHMLPYQLFISADPVAHFGHPPFKSWLKAWMSDNMEPTGTCLTE